MQRRSDTNEKATIRHMSSASNSAHRQGFGVPRAFRIGSLRPARRCFLRLGTAGAEDSGEGHARRNDSGRRGRSRKNVFKFRPAMPTKKKLGCTVPRMCRSSNGRVGGTWVTVRGQVRLIAVARRALPVLATLTCFLPSSPAIDRRLVQIQSSRHGRHRDGTGCTSTLEQVRQTEIHERLVRDK